MNTPILPLDLWRQEIGYEPWHFWGLADATIVPVTSKCNTLVREYGWQEADQAGRADIRSALMVAEQILFDNMAFWPAPVYTEATHPWPRYQDMRLERMGRTDARGRWVPVQLDEGKIRAVGIEAHILITAASGVTYTDNDGDGLAEDFTVTVLTAITDPDEIAVYFVTTDRPPEDNALSARWRIQPLVITFAAGTCTIKGKRWLMVKPLLYEDKNHYPIDPTVNANFAITVDVYRRYTYMDGQTSTSNSQSALIWESKPCTWCGCTTVANSTDPASEGWVAGRAGIRNAEAGIVTPAEAVYDAALGTWSHPCECLNCCGEPDKVLVRYLAGMELDTHGWMQKSMRTLVSRLACAEMNRRICACDSANREWSNWQLDLARTNSVETYQIGLDLLSNPLGTRRGHVYAWQQIKGLARVVGMLA